MTETPRQEPMPKALVEGIAGFLADADAIEEIETLIERYPENLRSCLRDGLNVLEQSGSRGLIIPEWVAILKGRGWANKPMWCVRILIENFGCCVTSRAGTQTYIYALSASPSLDAFDLSEDDEDAEGKRYTFRVLGALRAMREKTRFDRHDLVVWLRQDGVAADDAEIMADGLIRAFWSEPGPNNTYVVAKDEAPTIAQSMDAFRAMLHPGR